MMLQIPTRPQRRSILRCWLCLLLALLGTSLFWQVSGSAREPASELAEPPIEPEQLDHWAYLPLERPPLPTLSADHQSACRNRLDVFVQARLVAADLALRSPADRPTLLRRLCLDLTGLPPTPVQIDRFLQDRRPDAYVRLVDQLLGSSHFGERLAQPWLDLARFAETDGFEHDHLRPDAWRYRDWVIRSMNQDLPYDRFVALQLAGDELAPESEEARTATMFCLSGPDMPDINSQVERRHSLLNEMASTVSSVLLGLQLECAQCHDHKFDPISQADFYRLRAIFEPAVRVTKNKSVSVLRESGGELPASHLYERGDYRRPGAQLQPAFPRIANPAAVAIDPPGPDAVSSGRRLQLARWLTEPGHRQTSRVIANRIWQHHFGRGLAETPSDFGIMGQAPTHPQLLDDLASELVTSGWSMKHLHRLIVLSATYRQQSHFGSSAKAEADWQRGQQSDPANSLLWHFPRQRLPGEVLRDCMLAAAGVLNSAQGGPGIRPPLPTELVNTLIKGQWELTPEVDQHDRRSIYIFARRNLRFPIFDAFDRPDANASCAMRARSTTAPQSLILLNSDFSLQTARRMAGRIWKEAENESQFIEHAFMLTLARRPSQAEKSDCNAFLAELRSLEETAPRPMSEMALPIPAPSKSSASLAAATSQLCLALFNMNEFVYIE